MSGHNRISLRVPAIVLLLLMAGVASHAQCNAPQLDARKIPRVPLPKPALEEPVLPEAGFLTNTHYTSQFFGFAFDLPLTVKGHEIMLPVMPEKEHALLALQYEEGRRKGYIMVTAYDPAPGADVKTPEKERELRGWAQAETQPAGPPQIPVPAFMLRSNHFYHQIRRRGRDYAAQYWTGIDNYMVKVVAVTNDGEFLHKVKDAMADARFYCPQDDGTLTTEDGKPVKVEGELYAGPTVPTFRVNAALHDLPGKNIPRGEIVRGVYRNPDLGFQYELPQGWKALASDAIDPPAEPTALREYQFLHACSQTLLQIAPQPQDASDSSPGPEIVLRALDPNCLSMRTAAALTDKRALDEVAAGLEQLGEFGQIGSDELVSISGHLFMVFHGTIATSARREALAERRSQSLFATRYNKLLLVWSLMAPSPTALDELPTGSVIFEGSPPLQLHSRAREKR